VQNPLIAGERSVPQPDLVPLKPRRDNYFSSHPTGADVLLVVEVSDSTLAFDLATKIPLYARSGIPEVWVVDINAKGVRVFRETSAGAYRTSFNRCGDERVAAALLPDIAIRVGALFPE